MVSGHETDISEDLPGKSILNMLVFRGAPSGKALEAWRDNFFLKVGVVRIWVLFPKNILLEKKGSGASVLKNGPRFAVVGPDPTRIKKTRCALDNF